MDALELSRHCGKDCVVEPCLKLRFNQWSSTRSKPPWKESAVRAKPKTDMSKRQPESSPTWTDVKAKLAAFDRAALLDLIHNLYAAHKDNQLFLHTRFGLEKDVLEPYKIILDRWLWPDIFRNQDTSVAKAKQAISDYKMAVGDPEGLAELMVFYCERAAGFSSDIASDDEGFFNALVRMFERALVLANTLPASGRVNLVRRLDAVRQISHKIGYGVGDDMDSLLSKYGDRVKHR